jgi:hypothetical protein
MACGVPTWCTVFMIIGNPRSWDQLRRVVPFATLPQAGTNWWCMAARHLGAATSIGGSPDRGSRVSGRTKPQYWMRGL